MNALPRSTCVYAVLATALAITAAMPASAQRSQQPGPDTRRVLVTTFIGDASSGVVTAEEIRSRVQSEHSIRIMMPVSRKDMNKQLAQSGFGADTVLSASDTRQLAQLVRADEVIDGSVQKTAAGYRVTARMSLARDVSVTQPLLSVESNSLGDVARRVVNEYDAARKQLEDTQNCENAIRAGQLTSALSAARKAIVAYPRATLARLCLAQAYTQMKLTADSTSPWKDSVIAITTAIQALDRNNPASYQLQYDAYKLKGDTTNAIQSLIGYMQADPANAMLRERVIAELVMTGKAAVAVPAARQLLASNPFDVSYARTYWLVLSAAKNYKESVPAGEALVALDRALADSAYFMRQLQDIVADSAYAHAAEMASLASAKYPKSAFWLVVKAQNERKAGQLPAAKMSLERVMALDPKTPNIAAQVSQLDFDLGLLDDGVKVLKADAVAEPVNKERDAQVALQAGKKLYDAATASRSIDEFKRAIPVLQASDDMSPSPTAKFLLAVAAYQALSGSRDALTASKSCDDFKAASALLTIININMVAGASVHPPTAQQILGTVPQYQTFIDGSVKKFCK